MSSQSASLPASGPESEMQGNRDESEHTTRTPNNGKRTERFSPFWRDRLIEIGMVASMALYYVMGNWNLGSAAFFHVNPYYSYPFLALFAVLCWFRLSFAVALLPLALPYYLLQKPVLNHYAYVFSLAEITLCICLLVAIVQLLFKRNCWQYALSWQELRDRVGPFAIPVLVFICASAISVVVAYDRAVALRDLRREIVEPILYMLLLFLCIRERQDVQRLVGALLATGFVIALMGLVQYLFFKNTLVLEDGIRRVSAVYGSANSIGLLFDYVLPIGFAWAFLKSRKSLPTVTVWIERIVALAFIAVLLCVLYLTQSNGAEIAIAAAAVFILALSIRKRNVLLIGGAIAVVALGIGGYLFRRRIEAAIFYGHTGANGINTLTVRFSLWQAALNMIHNAPWFGYGLDNWLCHYSLNTVCQTPGMFHYWASKNIFTGAPLVGLHNQPDLSHPHNVLLQIWVSMGIFGVLAFIAVVVLFFWLFRRILLNLRSHENEQNQTLQWITIGVGAAMVAAMVQGTVDSAFLEQDLAYCFWILVALLLIIRSMSHIPWRGHGQPKEAASLPDNSVPRH
ncbi:MAG TPA: O-antigen ligase family protein [Ktedonobacteraceae bacterium]|nr:O-antigen ligase family protein [Ktedonobacteraceae bacterium]